MPRKVPELYLISRAAEMLEMHPQTLRKYERLGLVQPHRTMGSMRVYTEDEIVRLRLIKTFVDDAGINLAGVQRLLEISEVAHRMQPLVSRRSRRTDAEGAAQLERAVADLLRLLGIDPARDDDR